MWSAWCPTDCPLEALGLWFIGTHPPITCVISRDLAWSCAHVLELIFWHRLGPPIFQILVPTWPHFAPQLGPKIAPKSIQEPSKIDPKSHLMFNHFFDRFLIDFWSIFDPKINQKSIKNQSTNHPNNTTTKNWKTLKNHCFFSMLLATSAMSSCGKKPIKMVPTSIRKQLSNQHSNLHRFWSQLDAILGGFWEPRWGQVGTESLQQSIQKSIKKNDHPSDRSWVRFWSILEPFFINFLMGFERFVVDFLTTWIQFGSIQQPLEQPTDQSITKQQRNWSAIQSTSPTS